MDEAERLRREGSPLLALERYNRAVLLYDSPRAWFEMGRLYEALDRTEEAATAYRQASGLAPDWRAPRLATLALGFAPDPPPAPGELDEARQWARLHPAQPIPTSWKEFETTSIQRTDRTAAGREAGAQAAARRMPTVAEVRSVLFAPPAGEQALPSAENPDYPSDQEVILGSYPYHLRKARHFRDRGQWDLAAEEYEQACRIDPAGMEARLELGDLMVRLERPTQARFHYEQAVELFAQSPRPYLKMGNLMLGLGRREQARRYYEQALQRAPEFIEARNNLAVMAMQEDRHDEAVAILDQILEIDPEYANAWLNRGIIAIDIEADRAKALQCWRRYIELGGDRADEVRGWVRDLESATAPLD
jgi:tetratricopeptide (TPR) repeat protein